MEFYTGQRSLYWYESTGCSLGNPGEIFQKSQILDVLHTPELGSSLAKFSIATGVREFKAPVLSGRLEGSFLCTACEVSDINI